jgi:hypothetical protein
VTGVAPRVFGYTAPMSMTSQQRQEATCEICGRTFESDELLATHLMADHGGLRGDQPGGTGGAGSNAGSGPSGTTTSGSRETNTAPDSDDAGGTTERTEGGAGRVQTE